MKTRIFFFVLVATLHSARAQVPLYWDPVAGGPMGGTGNWSSNTALRWNTAADGSGTAVQWTDGSFASFGGSAGTVTVAGNKIVGGLEFTTGGYTINKNGFAITLNGGISVSTSDHGLVTITGDLLNTSDGATAKTITVGAGDSLLIGSWINTSQTAGIIKAGSGTLTLTNVDNNYTGGTFVTAGTLLVNNASGSATGNRTVTVSAVATLGGTGIIAPANNNQDVIINGALSPGDTASSAGVLSFNMAGNTDLSFGSGSSLVMNLGSSSDRVAFVTAGDLLVGSGNATLSLTLDSGFNYANTYVIFENVTTVGFTFADITGYDEALYQAVVQQIGTNYELSFIAVPEPGSAVLLGLAAGGMALIWRRPRSS